MHEGQGVWGNTHGAGFGHVAGRGFAVGLRVFGEQSCGWEVWRAVQSASCVLVYMGSTG